jgi:hypothetical protein
MGTKVGIPSRAALQLIKSGVSFEKYREQYPGSIDQELWIVKTRYRDYKKSEHIKYSGLPFGWSAEPFIVLKEGHPKDRTSGWVINDQGSSAFYFDKLESFTLPFEYARLVQYVDCMIDTSATIYRIGAEGKVYQQVEDGSKPAVFVAWARKFPGEPKSPDYDKLNDKAYEKAYEAYSKQHDNWNRNRILALDEKMSKSLYWRDLLNAAFNEALEGGNSSDEFEFYVTRYLSKEKSLELKRNRQVIGNCSMDLSPRLHAMQICQLAAETAEWDIFLRSHLDIMNDRFDRQSDGSYAWANRKTYFKELEDLDIAAIDLLLGTSLRVTNVNNNHYWGSIDRTGRALADVTDKDALDTRLLTMIQDGRLDPFNRLLIAYLFSHYAANLDDDSLRELREKKLRIAIESWPDYLQAVWKKN